MKDKENIITEIERRIRLFKKEHINTTPKSAGRLSLGGRIAALEEILVFIKSLPSEKQIEDFEEAFDEVLPNPNWYISNDGEDAYNVKQMEEMFNAGAKWQKEQDKAIIERAEDHAKLAGIALGEKEAKEKFVNKACKWLHRCIDADDEVKMIDGEPEALSFIEKAEHRIEVANQIVEDFKKAMDSEK